jgi:hypothetical protein
MEFLWSILGMHVCKYCAILIKSVPFTLGHGQKNLTTTGPQTTKHSVFDCLRERKFIQSLFIILMSFKYLMPRKQLEMCKKKNPEVRYYNIFL